jgi:DNA gyrase subunit A
MVTTKTQFGYVRPTEIEAEMRSSYLDYAMSVIVARALPDVRDGLKPVQRRILYAMSELGFGPTSPYKKSARIVGEVLGKFHPHGEAAVYDAMVRMAQPWTMRLALIDGQGNFGSVDDDPPAAMRYTEARLSAIAMEMLANLDQDTVDFNDNFDGTLREPVVLPARLPNLLINGAAGIAVGMATNIPPHNPSEICSAVAFLIDKPEATVEELMRHVKGPDFPTGAAIMGREGIKNAYSTGRGQVSVRARAEIEPMKRSNRMQIIVSELPFQVNKAALVQKIADLVKDKRIDGITEVRDESSREGMRVVIELRSGAQPQVILNQLYKFTAMQSSFSINMLALVDGMPRVLTLKQALQHFIEFRQQVVTRRVEFELRKARERAHILEGLRIALSFLDEVIALIRASRDSEEARNGLMSRFGLSEVQAQAILEMQLRRLAALEREKIENEYQELQQTIEGLEGMLADPAKVLAEVKREILELRKKISDPRRTTITAEAHELSREELEAHEQVVVTLSQAGYIKRISAHVYRNQHRGGKGVTSMNTKEDDPVKRILVLDTHDTMLFFTNKGRVLALKAYDLRVDTSRNTRGVPVINLIALGDGEKVNAVIGVSSLEQEDTFMVMATRKGSIKRLPLSAISSIRPAGLIIFSLKGDDELVAARLAKEGDDVVMVSERGMSIRFPASDITVHGRAAGGIKGMELRPNDRVISMDVGRAQSKLLVISKQGYGKLTPLSEYRRQSRGGLGVKTFNITAKTGPIAAAEVVSDSTEVYVVSEQAQVLRTSLSEIANQSRRTQGVTIFKPQPGDTVSSIACVKDLNKIIAESPAGTSANGKADGQLPLDGLA